MLNNEHCILYHQGDSIALIGVENDGEPPFSQFADLPKAMQGTEGMFRILLSHNPTHWRREVLPDSDIELTLSGHTHAMQMEIFGHSLSSLIYPEWSGMYYEGKTRPVCKCRYRIRRSAFPLRCMARSHRHKIS